MGETVREWGELRPDIARDLRLLTVREAAQWLNVSEWTVRRRIHAGDIPAVQLGRKGSSLRIPAGELECWMYGPPEGPA